ncbi:MAG: OmpA family protein [candidate division KSB1 bacterium]|nr:OmpA family protein [candidate division KSB1 bacterium]MDZ7319426.1 OmpA family protein [candidate division KSB1 bacterium]MDZ7340044.1 OmpA family protein [candidate division KSB1 bacterium]
MTAPKDKSLEALRQILLREDLIKLQKLEHELLDLRQTISDKESLIVALEPIIANLLERKIAVSREEMAEALAPIMGEAIRLRVAEAKEDVIDALYPVIGKIIRKSVAEAMKKFIDSVNQKIDQTLQSRVFRRRVQSKLTGVPENALVIKDSLPFKIEQIFLIHRESGTLISHVSSQDAAAKVNEELISGMVTAIRDFASEAFSVGKDHDMDALQFDDKKILVELGNHFYLALVITGYEPAGFQDEVHRLSSRLHHRFHKFFRTFQGELTKSGEITKCITRFFDKHHQGRVTAEGTRSRPYLLYLLMALVIFATTIFAIRKIPPLLMQRRLLQTIAEQFQAVPELRQQPLHFRLSGGHLIISGNVPSTRHLALIDSVAKQIHGLDIVQNRVMVHDQAAFQSEIIHRIQQQLQQDHRWQHLSLRFIVEDDHLVIEGDVPDLATKRDIGFMVSEMPGVHMVINNLTITASPPLELEAAQQQMPQYTIYFKVNDATIPAAELEKIAALLEYIKRWDDAKLIVTGYSDNSATSSYNLALSEQRAKAVADYLIAQNFPAHRIIIRYFGDSNPVAPNDTEAGRAKNRRVEFAVEQERQ